MLESFINSCVYQTRRVLFESVVRIKILHYSTDIHIKLLYMHEIHVDNIKLSYVLRYIE